MNKIICGVSARHVHLCQKDIGTLFGENYIFNKLKDTYNPGYVSVEKVEVCFPGYQKFNSRILLPATEVSQVELSKTDCMRFKIDAPLRRSFKVKGSKSCHIRNPKSNKWVFLNEGVIRSKRHIHLCPEDAEELNFKDGDYCSVEAGTVIFNNVLVRVADWYKTTFHIDTDEGNAGAITDETIAKVVENNE